MRVPMTLAALFALASMFLAACGDGGSTENTGGDATNDAGVARPAVAAEYAGKTNPFAGNADEIEKGRQLFISTCSTCHGDGGRGDGMTAGALNPKPSDFGAAEFATVGDDYLFWRISEGAVMEPFKSQRSLMTPYKSVFDEEDRWRLVAFIRSLSGE